MKRGPACDCSRRARSRLNVKVDGGVRTPGPRLTVSSTIPPSYAVRGNLAGVSRFGLSLRFLLLPRRVQKLESDGNVRFDPWFDLGGVVGNAFLKEVPENGVGVATAGLTALMKTLEDGGGGVDGGGGGGRSISICNSSRKDFE